MSNFSHVVLMIHDDYPSGGVQRSAMNIRESLIAQGLSCEILCVKQVGPQGLARRHDFVRPVSRQFRSRWRFWPEFALSLRRRLRQGPDHVYIGLGLNPALALLGCSLGLPTGGVVGSERIHPPLQPISRLFQLGRQLLFRRLDRIVVQSARSCPWYEQQLRIPPERLVVIPNVVRPAPPRNAPSPGPYRSSRPTLLCVGRLDEQKGFDYALPILARVSRSFPDCRLKLYGEGPDRRQLQQQAASLGVAERVEFDYVGNQLQQVWEQGDVFLFPSRYEGFPNALAEAMAHGLPCVAFNCLTGPEDLIQHGQNGYLVEVGDVAGASEYTVQLLHNHELREQMGQAARQVAVRFSSEAVGGLWSRLIASLSSGRR